MASSGFAEYVSARVGALSGSKFYCPFGAAIGEYHELKLTLEALAGHDTSELHDAIKETLESIVKLRAARDKAVERFKQQGVLITIAPVVKEEERLE
jgi:hypothetical protein